MAEKRFWDKPRRRRFKNIDEVPDPEIVVDTRPEPDEEVIPLEVEPTQPPLSPGFEERVPEPELEPVFFQDVLKPPAMQDVKPVDPTRREAIEAAGVLLIQYLPEETQALIREASEQMKLPIWQMLLGYAMRSRERDEVFFPVILSMWEHTLPANAPRPCGKCGLIFTSRFGESKYCCNPCFFDKLSKLGHTEDCPTRKAVAA